MPSDPDSGGRVDWRCATPPGSDVQPAQQRLPRQRPAALLRVNVRPCGLRQDVDDKYLSVSDPDGNRSSTGDIQHRRQYCTPHSQLGVGLQASPNPARRRLFIRGGCRVQRGSSACSPLLILPLGSQSHALINHWLLLPRVWKKLTRLLQCDCAERTRATSAGWLACAAAATAR